jgi:hypothetical protein
MERLLPLAAPYTALLSVKSEQCEEVQVLPNEDYLQALWYDDNLRPKSLTALDGSSIVLLEKGSWNHGDGPDFKNALVAVNGCLLRGDIECHRTPRDWDLHKHAQNPDYAHVVLHVTWEATPPAKTLPKQVVSVAILPQIERLGEALNFHQIHLPAPTMVVCPGQAYYKSTPGALERLLVSAGYHRFLLKAQKFLEKSTRVAPFQAFYEGLFRAMGYQRNAETFTRLAREVPFETLASFSSLQRFAILAGVAGLLKPDQRTLWDLWWQSGFQPPMEPFKWDLRGLRPQNHPYRRLAGGVGVLDQIASLLEQPISALPEAIQEASRALSDALALKGASIGISRANALVNNLFIPYRLATGMLSPKALNDLPGESISAPMREVWQRLTGKLQNLPKDALRQQGLLQINIDFCQNDHIVCATCPLANER